MERKNNLLGIYLSLVGVLVFGFMDIAVAYLTRSDYPVSEVMFMRSFWAIPLTLMFLALQGNLRAIVTKRLAKHLSRGLTGVLAMGLIFYSYKVTTLSTAIAIWFSSPIFVTLLSILFFKEKVGMRRWLAILMGFAGVLCVAPPSQFDKNILFPLGAAIAGALSVIQVKQLGRSEPAGVVALYFSIFACLGALLWGISFDNWRYPDSMRDAALFLSTGLMGGVGQIVSVLAIAVAEIAVIMPLRYLSLIWTTILAYLFFAEIPTIQVMIGAGLIVFSGLFTLYREYRLAKSDYKTALNS